MKEPIKHEKNRIQILTTFPKNGTIAEIGSCRGNYSEKMLYILKPAKLYLIDVWKKIDDYLYTIDNFKDDGKVIVLRLTSAEAAKYLSINFDMIYIDANRTYKYAIEDINLWWPKIKSGGILAGHDYDSRPNWEGVVQAVDEFVDNNNLTLNLSIEAQSTSWWVIKQ
jgi:predicted O-methyltransferase YrrM